MKGIQVSDRKLKISRSKLRRIFDREEFYLIQIRSLTPEQATGNALAIAVHHGMLVLPFRTVFFNCTYTYEIHTNPKGI